MATPNPKATLGRFVWHDLMTTDPGAAEKFYKGVAGWGTEVWPEAQNPYVMWTVDGEGPVGGTMRLPDDAVQHGAQPHWISYIETPDVDDTAARATALGATTMVPPTDIPTVGRFSVLADPYGATFAIFTPLADSPTKDGAFRPGDFTWHELATSDQGGALAFYAKLFGWKEVSRVDIGEGQQYVVFGSAENAQMGGIYQITPSMPMPTQWLPYIAVKNADTAAKTVADLGGRVIMGPIDVPGGDRVAMGSDPQGAMMAVHARGSAAR